MVLDTQQHVYTTKSACLGHLLPGWQDVRETLGELQWKHWEHSREGGSWKQGGAQRLVLKKFQWEMQGTQNANQEKITIH